MDPENIKVSIIVPIYNVDIYLRQCLDSLLDQTLDGLEVIMINDGSTDFSADIAMEYARAFPDRFFYYEESNSGLSAARNYGISLSRGEYIAFVDSDDFVEPDIYRQMYELAVADGSDLVCCGYDRIRSPWDDPSQFKTVRRYRFNTLAGSGQSIYESPSLLVYSSCYAWNKLYRRNLFETVQFPVGQRYEDSAIIYCLLEMANKISLINEVGYYYRIQRGGAITANYALITDIFLSMDSMIGYYKEKGLFDRFHDELEYLCFRHLLYARGSQLKKAPFSFVCNYIRDSFSYLNRYFPNWHSNKYFLSDISVVTPKYERQMLYYKNSFTCRFIHLCSKVRSKEQRFKKRVNAKVMSLTGKKARKSKRKRRIPAVLDQDILLEIQTEQRQILNVIHRFCETNGLQYYAAEGTLLGSIRHQGFIPWDDDMDLIMPREDFEKLIELWNTQSISECVLLCSETFANYYLPFIKIVHNENIRYTTGKRKAGDYYQGLSIDIFPLDAAVAFNSKDELKRVRSIRVLRDMMLYKVDSIRGKTRKLNCILHGAPFYSMRSIQKKLKHQCMRYDGQDVPYLANCGSAYAYSKEIFPREWWGQSTQAPFDDTVIMLPQNGEEILKKIYNTYWKLPPEEQQVCKHGYRRIESNEEIPVY